MISSPLQLPRAALFVDAGHYKYNLFNRWRIDYQKLIQYLEGRGNIISVAYYYEGMPSKNSYFHRNPDATYDEFNATQKKKKGYFKALGYMGYTVRHKPVRRIYDKETSAYKFKCNFDVEITMDVMDVLHKMSIDMFILCSGDGDFTRLVKHIKGHGKRTMVVGLKRSTNDELAATAHEVVFLEAIQDKIEREQ